MSLSVDVFVRDADGGMGILDVAPGCSDLAGFEAWRSAVRGSATVRSLGARFLPVRAEDDLTVEAHEVPAPLREVAPLRAHLDGIAAGTNPPRTVEERRHQLDGRPRNIEAAVRRALETGGGVLGCDVAPPVRRRRPGSGNGRAGAADGCRGEGQRGLGPSPRVHRGLGQPISSSVLPFVSFTNLRTNGMESAAKTV